MMYRSIMARRRVLHVTLLFMNGFSKIESAIFVYFMFLDTTESLFEHLFIVYAHGRRQHSVWFGHGNESIVDPQSTIGLYACCLQVKPVLNIALINRID